jgi:hypothetical protein
MVTRFIFKKIMFTGSKQVQNHVDWLQKIVHGFQEIILMGPRNIHRFKECSWD